MRLSRILGESKTVQRAEKGEVTLSSDENWEVNASRAERNIKAYLPYGYSAAAPVGTEVLLLPAADSTVALGARCVTEGLEAGEIKICSKGGASVLLKNDGTIVLNNRLVIDEGGNIHNGQ